MSEAKDQGKDQELKDYADGWILERKGTDVPPFLKFAFVVIGLGCAAYLVLQMHGDVAHATRGPLVKAFNRATFASPAFSWLVAGLGLAYAIIVSVFAFRTFKED
jgi:hypothetical protein